MSKSKFKVGDKVQLAPKFQKIYNSIGDKQGEVIKIKSNGNRSVYWVSFEDKKFMGEYYSYELDRASKFKAGDEVILTEKAKKWFIDRGYVNIDFRQVYTIKEVTSFCGTSYILNGFKEVVGGIVFFDDDLELYDESKEGRTVANDPPSVIDSKFHTGDVIKLKDSTVDWLLDYYGSDSIKQRDVLYSIWKRNNSFTIKKAFIYQDRQAFRINGLDEKFAFFENDLMSATRTDSCKEYDNITENEYHNRLKSNFKEICNRYLEEFCNRHDYAYHPEDWIGGEVGGIIEIADMFVTMDNIRYDVDNDIPTDKFSDWYWNSVEHSELGLTYMNYPSYCNGAPDPYTQEQIQSIRDGQIRVRQAKEDLMKTIDELGGDFSKVLF